MPRKTRKESSDISEDSEEDYSDSPSEDSPSESPSEDSPSEDSPSESPSPPKKGTKAKKSPVKAKKSPVKRAQSAYIIFCTAERPKIREEHPEWKMTDVAKELGKRWQAKKA
jgi:hypothetical protein